MNIIYHQLQGLYTAGDVLCAVDCARALPEYRHVFFVNHDGSFDRRVSSILFDLGVAVRRRSIVTEADVTPDLRAIMYHCVGHDDYRRGEYVRFRQEPPGVSLCAWIHTPGLCGNRVERYNYLRGRGCSRLIFDSSFSLHNTPGVDPAGFAACVIVNPAVDVDHYAGVTRRQDGTFRVGRWNRPDDRKYSDDFLDLLAGIDIPNLECLCMGIPDKFRRARVPPRVRLLEHASMTVEDLLSRLDVLIFKTHAPTWHEGWCRTVTEAMAAGVVPVVENRGGLPDQVIHGYNGFLCDTTAEFKHCCELLYHDPALRARLSANARAFARANFSLAHLRRDLLHLIAPTAPRRLRLVGGRGGRPDYLHGGALPAPGDVVATLDPFHPHLPFRDGEFDEIVADHALDHVENPTAMLEEIWRVSRHNAVITVSLDRTHGGGFWNAADLSWWRADSIDAFLPGAARGHRSPARFGGLRTQTSSHEIRWVLLAIQRTPGVYPAPDWPSPLADRVRARRGA